ncbi:hypothetical protein Cni_G03715 [Canna indica]|uniref:Uncharacterized protein n=1 Tax=Canna indica TaxID=4628 RepID=A0AAQ3Q1J2_9LILI|nr:hypothetical protein Cni_G03715 [Canna indica]
MGFELVVAEPPSLPPIRAAGGQDEAPTSNNSATAGDEEECCVTPKSEESKLKPALECPPAPRKPRPPPKRKLGDLRGFFPVPDDLSLVFTRCRPPTKRIRVYI